MSTEEDEFWDMDDDLPGGGQVPAPAAGEEEDYEEEPPEATGEEESDAAPPPAAAPAPSGGEGTTPGSVFVAFGIGGVVLVAGVVVFLAWALKGIGATGAAGKVDYPVVGQQITITSAETYWRKPDREKDQGIRFSARIIPACTMTLGGSGGSGALRFFFEDDRGSTIGDPVTVAVANGSFAANGNSETEIHATNGFDDVGDHAAYVTDQIGTWHLVVKEGPKSDAPGREFKELARIPITKQLR